MMKRAICIAAFAGAALSACAAPIGDRPSSAGGLVGPQWILEDIAGRGVIDYARVTLHFGQDGRLSGETSCNRYFADYRVEGTSLRIGHAGMTRKACAPALMDQERRFLDVMNAVDSYRIDSTGALVLSTRAGVTLTARADATAYTCEDGATVRASYPTTDTAKLFYKGRTIDMAIAISASGARYVGGGWQWWTKGMTQGTLAPLAAGEDIASARGTICTAR